MRQDIANLYAMVRIADEIVDGTYAAAGGDPAACAEVLAAYEATILAAPAQRFHVDPIVHAYALSARRCGFTPEHIQAFFASMRQDAAAAQQRYFSQAELDNYIYGSAEVIGLLCVDIFLADNPVDAPTRSRLEAGARSLGSAFQKVNFLRDLHEDAAVLGRYYFPGLNPNEFSEAHKDQIIAEIRSELDLARQAVPELPSAARAGVLAATELFSQLTDQLAVLQAQEIMSRRVSVPARTKAAIIARALWTASL